MKFPYLELRGKSAPIASYSIFHSDVADDLQIKLEKGKKEAITVGDGSQIIVYIHKIYVKISGREFTATIGFSRHLGIGFNIIGRLDVFTNFRICFDEKEKNVEFHFK